MLTRTASFTTTVLIALALTAVPCLAGEATNADTLAELAHLRAVVDRQQQQINRLLGQSNTQWLAERRTEQVQDMVRALMADADSRASLLESGMTAGYGKHFFIASEDGAFLLNTSIKLQLRYIYNSATHDNVITEIDDDEFGFDFRRTEIAFSGHVFDPRLTYKVKLEASRSSGTVSADDIYIGYKLSDDWRLRFGQFKVPFLREYQVSSGRQQAVERSYVNQVFNINRSQGAMLSFRQPNLQADLMIHDGAASKNRNFASDRTNIALAARGQWLLAGEWKQFKDFAAWDGEPLGVMLGGAVDWETAKKVAASPNPTRCPTRLTCRSKSAASMSSLPTLRSTSSTMIHRQSPNLTSRALSRRPGCSWCPIKSTSLPAMNTWTWTVSSTTCATASSIRSRTIQLNYSPSAAITTSKNTTPN